MKVSRDETNMYYAVQQSNMEITIPNCELMYTCIDNAVPYSGKFLRVQIFAKISFHLQKKFSCLAQAIDHTPLSRYSAIVRRMIKQD